MATSIGSMHELISRLPNIYPQVQQQLIERSVEAAGKMRDIEKDVLRGSRSGRVYRKPGTRSSSYRASAPGEPPAVRTNTLRSSFRPIACYDGSFSAAIETNVKYAHYLDNGTSKMAVRPIKAPIIEKSQPVVKAIYSKPFNIKL